jgi:hypothetical protein
MGVTATLNPHVRIIMSRVAVNMNPINLAVLGVPVELIEAV